ncbi:MAG TPA: SRPBCC family protein [Thermoanaerobaculia bacterium]|nr:SRPBCC family protein [Thermoanaerobaculia bacterium]
MRFVAESIIRATPERVFAFHALPDALERLTPPWAGSRVLAHARSLEVGARTLGEIRVAPFVWIRSEFEHVACEPPHRFVDEQRRGPFRSWRHEHRMTSVEGGTKLVDVIDFESPFGFIGRALAPMVILPRLKRLFSSRHEVTRAWCEASVATDR